MHFLDLPVEVLSMILEESRPDGFESLALTCKTLYGAAERYIPEHNDWTGRWSYIQAESEETPFNVLAEIRQNPLVAKYVRGITFADINGDSRWEDWEDHGEIIPKYEEIAKVLKCSARRSPLWVLVNGADTNGDIWQLEDAIARGSRHAALAVLLSLPPNIKRLTLREHDPWYNLWISYLALRAVGHDFSSLLSEAEREENGDPPCHHYSPTRLEVVEIFDGSTEDGDHLNIFLKLFRLPCLKTIRGQGIGGRFDEEFDADEREHHPSVTTVEMSSYFANDRDIKRFLSPLVNLRALKWQHISLSDLGEIEVEGVWNSRLFVRAIISQLGDTLETLSLSSVKPPWSGVRLQTFKGFRRLKSLELDLQLLLGVDRDRNLEIEALEEPFDLDALSHFLRAQRLPFLSTFLPDSIQSLRFMARRDVSFPQRMFAEGAHTVRKILPKLRRVEVAVDNFRKDMSGCGMSSRILGKSSKEQESACICRSTRGRMI